MILTEHEHPKYGKEVMMLIVSEDKFYLSTKYCFLFAQLLNEFDGHAMNLSVKISA